MVGDTKVELGQVSTVYGDEIRGIKVTFGKLKSEWEIHEQLSEFIAEFKTNKMTVKQVSNVELHGYAEMNRSF